MYMYNGLFLIFLLGFKTDIMRKVAGGPSSWTNELKRHRTLNVGFSLKLTWGGMHGQFRP